MMVKALFIILALFILPSRVYPAWAAGAVDVDAGKLVYEKHCAWCHGEHGAGDGPAAAFLSPAPRDFTFGIYKWKSTPFDEPSPSDGDFLKMIQGNASHAPITGWTGMNGTSMPGWSDVLSEQDALNVAAYLRKLSMLGPPVKPPVDATNAPVVSNEMLAIGKRLFEDRCAECHGQNGRGNGVKKLKDDWGGRTWPRNLTKPWTFRGGASIKDVYTRITIGIPGTQMPSFADPRSRKKLDENERWAVAAYAATLSGKKTPGGDTMIRAKMVDVALPDKPDDPAWEGAKQASFFLAPQMLAKEKHFTPSLDSIAVRAIYNSAEIAMLIEWDDPTMSVPGDKKSVEIAGGEVFPDGVAVQWPVDLRGNEKPFFGMGGEVNPVEIWKWQGPVAAGGSQTIKLLEAKGAVSIATQDASSIGFNAAGVYDDGTWRVVMRGALKTRDGHAEGQFIPVAFGAWDGSNNEKGSKHAMTGWQTLYLEPKRGAWVALAWAVAAGLAVLGVEILWVRGGKRKGENE